LRGVYRHIHVDTSKPLSEAKDGGHNRWHPAIAPLARVPPNEVIALDLRNGMDAQFTVESDATWSSPHGGRGGSPMTGPLYIERAEPGDLLEIEIAGIRTSSFGFTCIVPGFGLLGERFGEPFLVKWDIENNLARSRDLPGVAIPGRPFIGLMGVAPSEGRLAQIAERERELARRATGLRLPDPEGAVPESGVGAVFGLRPLPPREIGGNMDIRQLGVGSRLTLPVDVPGALFSAGDPHFAQGDGEACGVAIETSATVQLRFNVVKSADVTWRPKYPSLTFSEPAQRKRCKYVATTGLPIDSRGRNDYMNLNLAAAVAVEEMVSYLTAVRGLTRNQAYVLISVAADLRISEVVDIPNALVSVILPLDIFD